MRRLLAAVFACVAILLSGAAPSAAQSLPGLEGLAFSAKTDFLSEDHVILYGPVEIRTDTWRLFADHAEYFADKHMLVAQGNVTFTQGGDRLNAEWAEFDTEARTGVFHNSTGSATIAARQDRSLFGGQEPDMLFYGDTIEKVGDQKYRITHGGFTTCVQPTPRWELVSDSVTIRVDHYAFLRNPVLKVKNVPLFYLPAAYYPIKKENRATGFLLPMYGTSTYQGFRLSNAFFWAISRSQDATLMHDWYSKTGQGLGGEYRYVAGAGSQGDARVYLLNEKPTAIDQGAGGLTPARRSYEIRGNVAQAFGPHLRARGRVDYFSSLETQQLYHVDIYNASRRQRSFTGDVTGNFGGFTIGGGIDRSEYFFGETDSTVSGSMPRVSVNRAEHPIGRTPFYVSFGSSYANVVRQGRSGDVTSDYGLNRFDVSPRLRVPFTSLRFLTVNSSLTWHGTYYTESLAPGGQQVQTPVFRRYLDFSSNVVGPVLQRVFLPPAGTTGQRYKNVIEPFVTFRHLTSIDNYDQIVKLNSSDYEVGGTTQVAYGVTTRLLAKRAGAANAARIRELFSASVSQTYYTDPQASLYDYSYSTSFRGRAPDNFSPVLISGRATPTEGINAGVRLEYDPLIAAIQSISANGTVSHRDTLQVSAGWSHRLANREAYLEYDSLNAGASIRTSDNRIGGYYSFNFDLTRHTFIQSRFTAYYNMQCCGFGVEYQSFNFQGLAIGSQIPEDHRFNFSFTLAGLGTFSNFFGALGGAGR